jgi:hypothetical protein
MLLNHFKKVQFINFAMHYGHADRYELDYWEEKAIEAINKLKDKDKDLAIPKVTIQSGDDGI